MTPEEQRLAIAYGNTFGTEQGAITLNDLRLRCYMDRPILSSDLAEMAAREGARSVYLYIAGQLAKAISPHETQEEAEH